jgi:hypothetical protein
LEEEDKSGNLEYGEDPDKMLSAEEAERAYNRILALFGGNTTKADAAYAKAGLVGGFTEWYEERDGQDITGDWTSRFLK